MQYSIFYKRSPAGDELLQYAQGFAQEHPGADATHRFLRSIPGSEQFAALYAAVPYPENLHCEIGRQIRRELVRDAVWLARAKPRRVRVNTGPHHSYTLLLN